jgi:formate C-acetyltransferase
MLVRVFAQLGCQQLQLNALNVDTLRDAKIHPQLHKNLIVRVWGWSGYFCELSPEYQDQIIARHMYQIPPT